MLNAGQERALRQFKRWMKESPRQVFELSGGPGTGKTFLVRRMIEEIGLDLSEVLFCTYTGKAAIALRKNGLDGKTIHSTLYKIDIVERLDAKGNPVTDEDGNVIYDFKFIPRRKLDENIKLIVVDEASMVPQELIPEQIKANIANSFPGAIILKIDRNRRGYEVKLNNGLEVEFSPDFQVIDIDD
jgi:ATP-dependent exoDNAse (exonuclease V) alpha subunit